MGVSAKFLDSRTRTAALRRGATCVRLQKRCAYFQSELKTTAAGQAGRLIRSLRGSCLTCVPCARLCVDACLAQAVHRAAKTGARSFSPPFADGHAQVETRRSRSPALGQLRSAHSSMQRRQSANFICAQMPVCAMWNNLPEAAWQHMQLDNKTLLLARQVCWDWRRACSLQITDLSAKSVSASRTLSSVPSHCQAV